MSRESLCVLMFSGGRDSSISAIRLASSFDRVVLLTVTSSTHVGIERVEQRIAELQRILPRKSVWVHANASSIAKQDHAAELWAETCLPCSITYTYYGARLCKILNTRFLGFGYVKYQAQWIEQTSEAIEILGSRLDRVGIELLLPVSNIQSKDEARLELLNNTLSPKALEQQCTLHHIDSHIEGEDLKRAMQAYEYQLGKALNEESLSKPTSLNAGSITMESKLQEWSPREFTRAT